MEEQKLELVNVDYNDGQDFTAGQIDSDSMTLEKATQLFTAYDKMNALKKVREDMKSQRAQVVGGNVEISDKLSALIAAIDPEVIKELPDGAVDEIYGDIEIALEMDEKTRKEFKRDFLVYLRETDIANAAFEEEAGTLETAIAENQAELNELIKEFGDLSSFMRTKLKSEYDAAEGHRKETLGSILEAYDDSYTLNRVVSHYEKFGTQNTVSDYYHRADNVFERYVKVIKGLNFKTDLTSFNNLEVNFLEEKYQVHSNLFLFAVIKMYAYKKDATANIDGVFLSQLAVNLKSLYSDAFGDVEKKETFKAGIRRVLDLFI
jgi:hypothetical protein